MTPTRRQFRRARKAFALLAVLWVVLVVGLILLGVQKASRANLWMAHNELETVRAHWLARAGLEMALAILEDDAGVADGPLDVWYSDAYSFDRVKLAGGVFSLVAPPGDLDDPRTARCGLLDHTGLLNVNCAEAGQIKALCDLAGWQVDSILDWRDEDDNARPGGAEAVYYRRLQRPYLIRNGPLATVGELRLIRGIGQAVYTGEDANLNGILDDNENDLAASFPDDDGDGRLGRGLGGLATVYTYERNRDALGEKRVNVNSVGKDTLVTTFGFTAALAEGFVQHKAAGSGSPAPAPGKPKGGRFNSLMDLLDVKPARSSAPPADEKAKVQQITLKWLAAHLDELTLTDDERLPGRINVNTAPREVLLALPAMTPKAADATIQARAGGMGPFDGVGELLSRKTVSDDLFKAIAEQLTVRSNVLEVRSVGVTDWGIRQEIVAVIDRGTQPITVRYWYQSE